MAGFNPDDYVDVAERIRTFYATYEDGRLTTGTPPFVLDVGGKPFVVYHARAYRSPDDTLPGDGWAWEPVPGPTQFTRDSELMNAETAAWGRAIVALGFETKKIASAQEVRARSAGEPERGAPTSNAPSVAQQSAGEPPALEPTGAAASPSPAASAFEPPPGATSRPDKMTDAQHKLILRLISELGWDPPRVFAEFGSLGGLSKAGASQAIERLNDEKKKVAA